MRISIGPQPQQSLGNAGPQLLGQHPGGLATQASLCLTATCCRVHPNISLLSILARSAGSRPGRRSADVTPMRLHSASGLPV